MAKNDIKIESIAHKILVEPWITEATTIAAEANKYVFKVFRDATKVQIKKAIEDLYQVKVLKVWTINVSGKARIRGAIKGRKPGFKKAVVKLEKGNSINIYGEK
jgi:large subunit ribosomal protein L23